jgi:hypothetical protein
VNPAPDNYLKHSPLLQFVESLPAAHERCSWGVSPSNALVVSSAMDMPERLAIQIFLTKAVEIYGGRMESEDVRFNSDDQDRWGDKLCKLQRSGFTKRS